MASFVDSVRLFARGGAGGAGVASFQKRKGKPRGRPNGGNGGRGGNVVLVTDPGIGTLLRYDRKPHWKAGDGEHAEGELRHGGKGDDLELVVPLGTVVSDEDGVLMADMVVEGQRLVIAEGGRGGRGNASFVTPDRRAPSFAEQGEYGEDRTLLLELQLVADGALIGYPNSGKSTLVASVSAAKPKIANYPFTTLVPNLGVVVIDGREFVLADIPGLIEGAADGKGLGHEFLRHTERARVLVVLLDPSDLQIDSPERQYDVLVHELESHSPELAERPRVVVLNKTDLPGDLDTAWADDRGIDLFEISGVTGDGVTDLLHRIADLTEEAQRDAPDRESFVLHRPLGAAFMIDRTGDEWVVSGRTAERAVNLDDLTNPDAADLVAKRLVGTGIDGALRDAGAKPGDDVRIGDLVFTYDPDAVALEDQDQ
ncbi:MAG: GTPase ObgE [Actinomycetota bacterium]|nr:GTPase ObgE [Actinomycetota bacterium]